MNKHLPFSKILMISSIVFLNACGGSGDTKPPSPEITNNYTLEVFSTGQIENLSISWMGNTQNLSSSALFLTAQGSKFQNPELSEIPEILNCTNQLTKKTDTRYQYSVDCQIKTKQLVIKTEEVLSYPVTLKLGDTSKQISEGEVKFEVKVDNNAVLSIEKTGGPQTCSLNQINEVHTLSCNPFTLAYGIKSGKRGVYKITDQHSELLWQGLLEGLPKENFSYLNEQFWFSVEDNIKDRLYYARIENGQLTAPQASQIYPENIIVHQDTLFANTISLDGQGYTIHTYQDGEWQEAPTKRNGLLPISDFMQSNGDLYWYAEKIDSPGNYVLESTRNTFIKPVSLFTGKIDKTISLPQFRYDEYNFIAGFNADQELIVNMVSTYDKEAAVWHFANVKSASLWQGKDQNQYLFYTEDQEIKQLSFKVEGVETSKAFDFTRLSEINADWIGGDLSLLLAGNTLFTDNDEFLLTYMKSHDAELNEDEIKELIGTSEDVRIKATVKELSEYLKAQSPTPVVSNSGYLLVFTGDKSSGSVYLINASKAYKVQDGISWDTYLNEFTITSVSNHHISVLGENMNLYTFNR